MAPRIVGVAGGGVWRRVSEPYPTAKFQPILGYERKLAESDQSPHCIQAGVVHYWLDCGFTKDKLFCHVTSPSARAHWVHRPIMRLRELVSEYS